MKVRALRVADAWEFSPAQHADDRGVFLELFRHDLFERATGRTFDLRQANVSVSKRGVVRGVHFASVPNGQAKYVTASAGSVIDFIIDLRVGSPTFGRWDSVELNETTRSAVFLSEGLGHLFVATSESATVTYLTNDVYRPELEHTVNPLDAELALALPTGELLLSPRDEAAPSLAEALAAGILPQWQACLDRYSAVKTL